MGTDPIMALEPMKSAESEVSATSVPDYFYSAASVIESDRYRWVMRDLDHVEAQYRVWSLVRSLKLLEAGAGGLVEQEFHFPVWFDAVSHGLTPMNAAFRAIVDPLRAWIGQHPGRYPPIPINLTDGAYTAENPLPTVHPIRTRGTGAGNVLIFSHGHFSRVLAARWLSLPAIAGRYFVCGAGSLGILSFEHDRLEEPVVSLWNDMHHLETNHG